MGNTEYSIRWLQPQNISRAACELLSIDNGSVVAIKVPVHSQKLVDIKRPTPVGSQNRIQETPSRMGSKSVNEHHSKRNVLKGTVLPAWVTIQGSPGRDMTLYIKARLSNMLNKGYTLESLHFVEMRRYRTPGSNYFIDCCLYKYVISKTVPGCTGTQAAERTLLITTFNGMFMYSDPDKIEWRYVR
jgi:hypothetical protein